MAALSRAKLLGGVGSILVFIPFASVVGYVLLVVAVRDVSKHLQDGRIFRNIVVAAGTGIVGALAAAYAIFEAGGAGLSSTGSALLGLFVAWVFLVASGVFLRRSYGTMAQRLGVRNFGRAATLYLVGAGLTIIALGLILLFVAQIIQAVAYFSMPSEMPGQEAAATAAPAVVPPSVAPAPVQSQKFCTSCGAAISPTATFCYNCGAKQ
jgi:uncharacterized membrane protein